MYAYREFKIGYMVIEVDGSLIWYDFFIHYENWSNYTFFCTLFTSNLHVVFHFFYELIVIKKEHRTVSINIGGIQEKKFMVNKRKCLINNEDEMKSTLIIHSKKYMMIIIYFRIWLFIENLQENMYDSVIAIVQ